MRWLHIYTSMFSLLIVLFFAATGITMNHPDWLLGTKEVQQQSVGTLPQGWKTGGTVNWLKVAEHLRTTNSLHGTVADGDYQNNGQEASLSFHAPGYSADAFIDMGTGKYTVTTHALGAMAVMNDLHKGRDTGPGWKWAIDLSAGFLVLISLTGLAMLIFLKKIRPAGLMTLFGGAVLTVVVMKLVS